MDPYIRSVLCYKVKLQHWSQRSLIERTNYSIYHFLCPAWFTQSHVRIYLSAPARSVGHGLMYSYWSLFKRARSIDYQLQCSQVFCSIPRASPQNSFLCSHRHSFQLITSPPLYHKFLRVMKIIFPGHEYGTSDFNSMVPRILYRRGRNSTCFW